MADAADLCTLAQVKAVLRIPDVTTGDDARLGDLITDVSDDIRDELGRQFSEDEYEETRRGRGGTTLFVREPPIQQVKALTVAGVAIPQATDDAVAGWFLGNDGTTIELRGYVFTRGATVRTVYIGGYADGELPQRLVRAAIDTVAYRFRDYQRIGLRSETLAQQTTAFEKVAFPASARRALDRLTVPMVA